MKKNNLKKAFALGLSTALVSMSCLNASAMDYKKILNKKNISIATLGSAAVLGSYFLYNHFKAQSTEKSQDEGQLVKINNDQIKKSEKSKENVTEEKQKPTEKKAKDQQNEEKFEAFDTSDINEFGMKKGQDTKPMLIKSVKAISEGEKFNIVKGKDEKIESIRVSKKGRERENPLLIFSNEREIEGNDLNLDENFRQDQDSKMFYFKLDGKLYELGERMFNETENNGPISDDDYFFACADQKIWDRLDLFYIRFCYDSGKESFICKEDSWRALLFTILFK